jgi:hypothetical protein
MSVEMKVDPIRFDIDPRDTAGHQHSALSGVYNFIIPAFKKTPQRYRKRFLKDRATDLSGIVALGNADLSDGGIGTRRGIKQPNVVSAAVFTERIWLGRKDSNLHRPH